jgi:outer membrane protein OmpA-like peptidoglycan-associated protein
MPRTLSLNGPPTFLVLSLLTVAAAHARAADAGGGTVIPPSFDPAAGAGGDSSDGRGHPGVHREFLLRAPSLTGATGLLHTSTAAVGPVGELRLGLRGQDFAATNFLGPSDSDQQLRGDLVWGVSPRAGLELFGDFSTASNRNRRTRGVTDVDPEVIRTGGRLIVGAKVVEALSARLGLGLEGALRLAAGPSDLLISLGATSWWLGPVLSYDGIGLLPVPFRVHLAASYFADHSTDLGSVSTASLAARQAIRFAYGMEPGRFRSSFGLEVPVRTRRAAAAGAPPAGAGDSAPVVVVPFLEFGLERLTGGADPVFKEYIAPGCGTTCSNARVETLFTLGVRSVLRGDLSVEVGLDLRGQSASLRYGPPLPPYQLGLGLLYPLDLAAGWARHREDRASSEPATTGPSSGGGSGAAAGGAATRAPAPGSGTATATADGGGPASAPPLAARPSAGPAAGAAPGQPGLAPNAAPGASGGTIDSGAGVGAAIAGAPATPSTLPPDGRPLPELRLEGRGQLRGRVTDSTGRGLQAALVLRGPRQSTQAASDGQGGFALQILPGRYSVRVQSPGFELQELDVDVAVGTDTRFDVRLQPPSSDPNVQLQTREIKLARPIRFVGGITAELTADSQLMLKSVAALLAAHPELRELDIVAHTDGEQPAPTADALTQRQAESVRAFLVSRGVAEGRLHARGVGAREPLVPDVTQANRGRNRRVDLRLVP